MNKRVLLAAGLAVLSTNAFATKARMEALSQDANRGSFFIDDSRNIFRNASKVGAMKNFVVTEWGDNNNAADAPAAPHAEGGFFNEAGAFAYGLYFGSDINDQNADRTTRDAAFQDQDNRLNFFLAGDAGVEWGVRLDYANGKTETTGGITTENSALGVGLGVTAGDLEAWANLDLKDESTGATAAGDKFEADLGMEVGASYKFSGMTAFADYSKTGYEYTSAATFKPTEEDSSIQAGLAKVYDHGNGARVFTSVAYKTTKNEDKQSATTTVETKRNTLPVTIGFEADATTWLTLRGSVSQPIIINNSETKNSGTAVTTKSTNANQTDVAAGATLNFGKLKVDGSIGTLNPTNAATESGTLKLDNLMTRVAVAYWF